MSQEPRYCKGCGAVLVRRPKERPSQFAARLNCGPDCREAAARRDRNPELPRLTYRQIEALAQLPPDLRQQMIETWDAA